MKPFFMTIFILSTALTLNAAKLYYSDGTYAGMQKAEGYSAELNNSLRNAPYAEPVMKMSIGKRVYRVYENDKGSLPVYFLGDMPVVADSMIFWRGEKSVVEMEKKYGLKLIEILDGYQLYSFKVLSGDSVEIAEKIVDSGDGFAFPNLVREAVLRFTPARTPDDPYFDEQWHLSNTGSVVDYYGDTVGLKEGSDIKFLQMLKFINEIKYNVDDTVKVAIMDTGVVPDHEDLTNVEAGYDSFNDTEGGYPDTSEIESVPNYEIASIAHGTTCAGVSAGEGNNIGMSGVCPWCGIYPVRYLDALNGTAVDDSVMLKIYERYVADPKISVINCSFGPSADYGNIPATSGEIESITNFMQNGRGGLGGAVIYAAGNDGIDAGYAKLMETKFSFQRNGTDVTDEVVAVAATSPWDTRVTYSNFGESIDIAAPSLEEKPLVGIATTTIPGYGDYMDDYTLIFSGTSAATPVVTGLFGVIFSINPNLTLEKAMDIMKKSSDKVYPETGSWDSDGHSVKFGWGRVNVFKAARLAMGLDMCLNPAAEETCGNNTDDDCDGFVDEGCETQPVAGTPCETVTDCLTDGLTESDAECLTEIRYWIFKKGYCVRKTNNAPCPDGTKAFEYTSDGENYLCAKECSAVNPCARESYHCSNDVLGICLPTCSKNSDCREGSYCDINAECAKTPSSIGGSCQDDDECQDSMWCLPPGMFDEGYCTQNCIAGDNSSCPAESKCITRKTGGGSTALCLASCDSDSDCRNNEFYTCHARISGEEGVCYRKCSNDADCIDDAATCNSDGRCVPEGWTGWPGDETEDVDTVDEDSVDSDIISENGDIDTAEVNDEAEVPDLIDKSDSSGCSVITL